MKASPPLSVAVVAPLVAPLADVQAYGNHIFLMDLARGLAARGHRVVIYAAAGSRVGGVEVEAVAVDPRLHRRFFVLGENSIEEARLMRQAFDDLFGRLRRRRHDVVSQHAFDAEAMQDCGVPTLHTLHLAPVRRSVVEAARTAAGTLATVSQRCAALWREAAGREIEVIPNGVPAGAIPERAVRPLAVSAGRISREKGSAAAVRIAHRAGLVPVLIGEVYDAAYFREEVQPLGGFELVPTLPRAELLRRMAGASITLLPVTGEEAFGLVAAEAQLAGCPVAAYRLGGLPEVIEDGVTGFLATPGDEDALVEAARRAGSLDRRRIRRLARERFGIERCLSRYEAVLKRLRQV
jgi:glycosyltransferase involved in cell wall biosynthesis